MIAVCLLLLVVAASGCSASWMTEYRGPEVVHNYQPSDIPVPLNFELSDDPYETWANIKYEGDPLNIRVGKFTYTGTRPIREVADWYLEQMPIDNWEHKETTQRDDIVMRFEKGLEYANIRLARIPDDNGEFYITKLTAKLGAK